MTVELLETNFIYGLVLALIAFGIMIPFRLLNFADLSAEGAYPLGGAMFATLLSLNMHYATAMFIAILSSGLMGFATAHVALRLKINTLLSGIILSTMAYSINLRIMGKPNLALFNHITPTFSVPLLLFTVIACYVPFYIFLQTDFGLRLRATGLNPRFSQKNGINTLRYTSLGLFLSGCLFGLSGALTASLQQFMDIGMGIGIVIHGLASLMLGEAIIGIQTLKHQLISPLIGALVYQQIQGFALASGLTPSDLKFFTGLIVLGVIMLQRHSKNAPTT